MKTCYKPSGFTCYKCNKQLVIGKQITMNGIKYECVTAEDIALCAKTVKENEKYAFRSEQQLLSKLDNVYKCTKCNNLYFKELIVFETMPPRYECSNCYKK